jgi:hypothetical protein
MITGRDMEEINELFAQINSLLDRMKHLVNEKPACNSCAVCSDKKYEYKLEEVGE